jgi:hypothetical protein
METRRPMSLLGGLLRTIGGLVSGVVGLLTGVLAGVGRLVRRLL